MAPAPTKLRTATECDSIIAHLHHVRLNDLNELADLSSLRSGILLHGSELALAKHDARRVSRQRHYDWTIKNIASAEDERDVAALREETEAADATKPAF